MVKSSDICQISEQGPLERRRFDKAEITEKSQIFRMPIPARAVCPLPK
jgi:hypothetical protein